MQFAVQSGQKCHKNQVPIYRRNADIWAHFPVLYFFCLQPLTNVPTPISVEECEVVRRLVRTFRDHCDPQQLLSAIPRELAKCITFDAIGITQVDVKSDSFNFSHYTEDGIQIVKDIPCADTMTEWVLENSHALVIEDADTETRFAPSIVTMRRFRFRSACVLPLSTTHRKIGSLSLGCRQVSAYQDKHVHFLLFVADQLAMAMDDAIHSIELRTTLHELAQNKERLRLLMTVSNALSSSGDTGGMLGTIASNLQTALGCDCVAVALPQGRTGRLLWHTVEGAAVEAPLRQGTAVSNDIQAMYEAGRPVDDGRAGYHVPIIRGEKPLGLITALGEGLTEAHLVLLGDVARQLALVLENSRAYAEIKSLKDQLCLEKIYIEDEIRGESNFAGIIGQSAAIREVLHQAELAAPATSPLLIYGNRGTGKELIARAIHKLSGRGDGPFVKLNCAALSGDALERELFGEDGDDQHPAGRLKVAPRGTLFLDEVGELPLELQPRLLGLLQAREFQHAGSPRTVASDTRMIASSSIDLAELVEQGKFRLDLFYHVNVFSLRLPPLNQRKEDIPLLVRHFVRNRSNSKNKTIDAIPSETMDALVNYDWPGNVRELENVIERAMILSAGPILKVRLSELFGGRPPGPAAPLETLEKIEEKHIIAVLRHTNWVVAGPSGAARVLGVKRTTLQAKMQRLGIRRRLT